MCTSVLFVCKCVCVLHPCMPCMCVCVCVQVCVYACMHVVHMYACVHALSECVHVCICVHVCMSFFVSQVYSCLLVPIFELQGNMSAGSPCPLIQKLPQRKRSSDSTLDRQLLKERIAFHEILQLAWDNPSKRLSFLAEMKLELEAEQACQANSLNSEIMFTTAPPTLGQVDLEWAASFLGDQYPLLSAACLGNIKAFDSTNLRNMFNNCVHAAGTMKLPLWCQDQRVLRDLLNWRIEDIGVRMVFSEEIVIEIIAADGKVNWGRIGPFALNIETGREARAYHRPTDSYAPIDSDLQVQNGDWDLDKNWSDTKCTLEKGPARKHKMIDFWTKNSKPWQKPQWGATVKHVEETCARFAKVYADKEKQLVAAPVTALDDDFVTPTKTKQAQKLKEARVAADKSKDERAAKRRCLIADAVGSHHDIQCAQVARELEMEVQPAKGKGKGNGQVGE